MQVVNAYLAAGGGGGGGTLPYFVGTPTNQSVGIAAINIAMPAHQADDILLAVLETANASTVGTPSGWSILHDVGATDSRHWLAWKRAVSSAEGNLVTNALSNHGVCMVACIRGCVTTGSPFQDDQNSPVSATDLSSIAFSSATTTDAAQLIVFAGTSGADIATASGPTTGGDPTGGTGLSNMAKVASASVSANNGGYVYIGKAEKASPGATGSVSMNVGTAEKVSGTTLVLKPA